MGKKKKKAKAEAKEKTPPVDPLTLVSAEELKYYKECFEMFDKDNEGKIDKFRVIDIMNDISVDKVDTAVIEQMIEDMAINKDKKDDDDDEFEIDFLSFLRIVVLYLKGNIEMDEHRNAF